MYQNTEQRFTKQLWGTTTLASYNNGPRGTWSDDIGGKTTEDADAWQNAAEDAQKVVAFNDDEGAESPASLTW